MQGSINEKQTRRGTTSSYFRVSEEEILEGKLTPGGGVGGRMRRNNRQ